MNKRNFGKEKVNSAAIKGAVILLTFFSSAVLALLVIILVLKGIGLI